METPEELLSSETLKRMIKAGTAENCGPRGLYYTDENLPRILEYVERKTKIADQSAAKDERSRIILIPVNSLPENILEEAKIKNQFDSIAICFTYLGRKVDKWGRSTSLAGLAIMSNEDAQKIQDGILKDPKLLFSLIRAVNNGPIKRYDDHPMELTAGKHVSIFPNTQFGGEVSEQIQSNPFPENFDSNPL